MPSLDILIPTFNRKEILLKNLALLRGHLSATHNNGQVGVIVGDNCSSDGTAGALVDIRESMPFLRTLLHDSNLGLEENCVRLLQESVADYCMFLGDDDFISDEYLKSVLHHLSSGDISCIVPSFLAITESGQAVGSRDISPPVSLEPSEKSAAFLAARGHQLSGVCFRREGTLTAYLVNSSCRNLYPFMFFVAFNCYRGRSVLLSSFPVLVTVGAKKHWGYGKDGLTIDKLKNARALRLLKFRGWWRVERALLGNSILGLSLTTPGPLRGLIPAIRLLSSGVVSPIGIAMFPILWFLYWTMRTTQKVTRKLLCI